MLPIIGVSQTLQDLQGIGNLLTDALFYSEKFIQPATDASIYQASSGWMITPKKNDDWKINLSVNGNFFLVPNSDRTFEIKNSDFKFFQIENATQLTVPSAIGDNQQYFLVGNFSNSQVRLKTPEGVNSGLIIYPYLQLNFALKYGFEIVGRYSIKNKIKDSDYQVYGVGLKHNFSHYLLEEESKWHAAVLFNYSKEEFNLNFLDVTTPFGTLGLNNLSIDVDTFQSQLGFSKEFNSLEIVGNLIYNKSTFNYKINSPKGTIEEVLPAQETVDNLLNTIEYPKDNFIGELGCNYSFSKKWQLMSKFAFGKFLNFNLGINYQIN